MEPLTPGTTIVAAAMTPTPNSFTTLITLKLTSAAFPLVSPITAIKITIPKNTKNGMIFPTVTACPFTFLKINGRLPAIRPQNAKFVGIGYVSSRNSNNLDNATIAIPAPIKIGIKSFILSLNSFFRCVMAWISRS